MTTTMWNWILTLLIFALVDAENRMEMDADMDALNEYPPRFHQSTAIEFQRYLGDKVKLRCYAVGRPKPTVHWMRYGKPVEIRLHDDHLKENTKHMTLDIKRVQAEDAGEWSCLVRNAHAAITRNFTIEVLDLCDFYLNQRFVPAAHIPLRCVCFWKYTGEAIRSDIDFRVANLTTCRQYERMIRYNARKPFMKIPCFEPPCDENSTVSAPEQTHVASSRILREMRPTLPPQDTVSQYSDTLAPDHPKGANWKLDRASAEKVGKKEMTTEASEISSKPPFLPKPEALVASPNSFYTSSSLTASSVPPHELPHDNVHAASSSKTDPLKVLNAISENGDSLIRAVYPKLFVPQRMLPYARALRNWTTLTGQQKRDRAREFIKQQHKLTMERDTQEDESEENGEEEEYQYEQKNHKKKYPLAKKLQSKQPSSVLDDPNGELTPAREALDEGNNTGIPPYFVDSADTYKIFISPAGRTLRLTCRAGGNPPPSFAWERNGNVISTTTLRNTGGLYRQKHGLLELEDATESDSGMYDCEVYNSHGRIRRTFNVTIINRMRTAPLIVPNILQNITVNVNDTATFHCKVLSDLIPHIIWLRVEKKDGKYYYYNKTAEQFMFHYTEIDEIPNARVITVGDSSTLEINNVQLSHQGLYSCITGNSLGKVMANATLTVNEFHGVHIPTGVDPDKPTTLSVLLIVIFIVIIVVLILLVFIALCVVIRQQKKQEETLREQRESLLPKRTFKLVSRRRPVTEGVDGEFDLAATYQIQIIEKDADDNEIPEGQRQRLDSDASNVSEVEVEADAAWEIPRDRLVLGEMLGEGAFGEVWKGIMKRKEEKVANVEEKKKKKRLGFFIYDKEKEKDLERAGTNDEDRDTKVDDGEIPVAVKKLKSTAHHKELIDLFSEAHMFKLIGKHENVLQLIGCCTGKGPLYVVLELCSYGNLRDFLRAHRPKEEKEKENHPIQEHEEEDNEYLSPKKVMKNCIIPNLTQRHLVEFAWQIAKGMKYVSSHKIIHRDLAARNVLVTDTFMMKISDFGLSRDVQMIDYYRKKGNGRLPIKWMAIEALDSHVYTVESDVWSFGILLWEIMTLGGTPYPTIAMPQLYACLKEGYRMEAPHNCPDEIYNLMVACWQEKRELRPNFDTIVDYFDWMLTESAKAEELNDEETTVKSGSSGDFSESTAASSSNGDGGSLSQKKIRPLSAPVLLPSEPASHDICEDEEMCLGDSATEIPLFEMSGRLLLPSSSTARSVPSGRSPVLPPPLPIQPPREAVISNDPEESSTLVKEEGPDSAIGSPSAIDAATEFSPPAFSPPFLEGMADSNFSGIDYVNIFAKAPATMRKGPSLVTHFTNIETTDQTAVSPSRFQFPPATRLLLRYNVNSEATTATPIYEGTANIGYMPSPLPPLADTQRRYSIGSASSGRGGSSAASSAEGLVGGIQEFCRIDYEKPQLKRQANSLDDRGERSAGSAML